MTPEEALELIRQGEGRKVEFKQSFSEDNEAIESLCAFANADGGTVIFGVSPRGEIQGTSIGSNTLENFGNKVRAHSDPPMAPYIDRVTVDGRDLVAVAVPKHAVGQLFYAFRNAYVRVGLTNQVMTPDECRTRLLEGREDWSEDRDRPHFEVTLDGVTRLETELIPQFKVRQFSGDPVANLQWRIRGPRFGMEWRTARGAALDRTHFVNAFDLTRAPDPDEAVGLNEMGFEIRFYWHHRWRTELRRWPITRRELPTKVLWDVGAELLPPIEADEP